MKYLKPILIVALLVLVLPGLAIEATAAEQLEVTPTETTTEDCEGKKGGKKNCGGGGGGGGSKPPKPPKGGGGGGGPKPPKPPKGGGGGPSDS